LRAGGVHGIAEAVNPATPPSRAQIGAATPAPDWRERGRRLLSDLLVFDARRFGWRLASRTMIALILPMALGRWLGLPALNWVAISAFLLAIGDSTDDGDRLQLLRLAVGTAIGATALATGVLAGSSLWLAIPGTLAWTFLVGLVGVYGNAAASMGLPIAWAYVELGLPSGDHSIGNAAALGGWFAAGGAVLIGLTWLIRIARPYGPLRHRTAACFRAVATYLATVEHGDAAKDVVSPETRVRMEIAEARQLAADLRRGQRGWSLVIARQIALIEIADRVFTLAAVLRDEGGPAAEHGVSILSLCAEAAVDIAGRLSGPFDAQRLRDMSARLAAAQEANKVVEARLVAELLRAVRIVLGDAAPDMVTMETGNVAQDGAGLLAPLLACFDRRSLVARHALRFAVVTSLAVVIFWFFPKPFGYWIPLTVTVVLRPYAGVTLSRTVQRIIGTAAGILVSSALMPFLTTPDAQLTATAVAIFCMMATLPFNYSLAIFMLSAGVIPLEHFMTPALPSDVGVMRLAATGIGATLAILGGHLLWPAFERDTIPALLTASIGSIARYAGLALSRDADLASIETARREAGRDTTNLQATVQHSVSEIGGDVAALHAAMLASLGLQRLMNGLNTAVIAAPASDATRARLVAIVGDLSASLDRLGADGGVLIDVVKKARQSS
jgi:uncharacterized membrane protein YccC